MAKKKKPAKKTTGKTVAAITHGDAARINIPTAEHESVMKPEDRSPVRVAYERRNRDLDPQLIWRGKYGAEGQEESDLVVQAPPLYIQEKVHPKVLIDDLLRRSKESEGDEQNDDDDSDADPQALLFGDLYEEFNGFPEEVDKTDFYQHEGNWQNRMILGDSLQVMASLAEREGLRGQVQCIYLDPPYGIKFNSNFQWSTTSRDVKDGKADHITREPEQVKAFRDTWRDGIHSYLNYLRDRLTVGRELLHETGSIFVQIGDENVHRVRAVMDEVFGEGNFCRLITFRKTAGDTTSFLPPMADYIIWYAKSIGQLKARKTFVAKELGVGTGAQYDWVESPKGDSCRRMSKEERDNPKLLPKSWRAFTVADLKRAGASKSATFTYSYRGKDFHPGPTKQWKTNPLGIQRLDRNNWLLPKGEHLRYKRYFDDFSVTELANVWVDTGTGVFTDRTYVVQTSDLVVQRCLLMSTDPGDLVIDPTCGGGTTAHVAEQWGRRWITIDTSRVSLALARARIMGARYPYYLLADSREGVEKEAAVTRTDLPDDYQHRVYRGSVRQGFVYERVPHITLKSIANNAEIDIIWDKWHAKLEPLRAELNALLERSWEEWEIPRVSEDPWDTKATKLFWELKTEIDKSDGVASSKAEKILGDLNKQRKGKPVLTLDNLPERPVDPWPEKPTEVHAAWWDARFARQKEIDASIAAKADFEYLYDKPYTDNSKARVTGPFTVESLSPHRELTVGADDELIDPANKPAMQGEEEFEKAILENLKTAGVQQAHKEDKLNFTSITPWPGEYIAAEGRYVEGDADEAETQAEKRAGIFIGPEFGTVSRQDLVAAAREAGDAGFDVVVACAFNYDARASEFSKLGAIPVLKARMNADLHMAGELANTGKGNLFVIFGEPDIDVQDAGNNEIQVKINGVDVFHPNTGEVRSDGADGIACWFLDTDYNEESFFVRHAYFLGAGDPYKALKTTLKAEINQEAWDSLHSDTSRPFPKPKGGRIAVKVINHLGDEVMKVFKVE